jgi:hypothetical protein
MKKLVAAILSLTTLFSLVIPATAYSVTEADTNNYIYVESLDDVDWDSLSSNDVILIPNENLPTNYQSNYNLSDSLTSENPIQNYPGIVPFENTPPSAVWNIANKGQYNFSGYTFDSSYLYTNYIFTGKSSYRISITNLLTSDSTTAKFMGSWQLKTYRTVSVIAGVTAIFSLNSNHGISSSTQWMIRFTAPVKAEGYVK